MKRSGAYFKLFYHFIWSTRSRLPLITPALEPVLYNHLQDKCRENGYRLIALSGTDNHIHLLIELKPTMCVADVAKILKGASSHYINKESGLPDTLYWQDGYGVLSLREGDVASVTNYINNQREHHAAGKLSDVLERVSE